ncbi:MAG: MOSC domain-containing protein [Rhodobacteraceae bacterium]|nr:MOSC domain-containing protein [Paracoccaceae bacterium]
MDGTIRSLQHYPIKGLSPAALPQVTLTPGDGFPMDRMFGLARAGAPFDPADPQPMDKNNFVVLARYAELALLDTRYDPDTGTLRIDGQAYDMADAAQCRDAIARIVDCVALNGEAAPRFVSAAPHRFTDVSVVSPQMMNAVSIINHDSVADFSSRIGREVDPQRFRGNIEVAGWPAQSELEAVGAVIGCGDVRMRILKRTQRCAATEVNPQTGARDIDLPRLLRQTYGHMDMGVYAEVIAGGTIAPGMTLSRIG